MGRLPRLGVNIDHIATLRELRGTPYPSLLQAAQICESAGAEQITVHLREDRRHIQDEDVRVLRAGLKVLLNLEMSVADSIVRFAVKNRPDWACLVPEKRKEVTTEGGLDVLKNRAKVARVISKLHKAGIRVSLFVEPDLRVVQAAHDLGADAVELHTGRYCLASQQAFGKKSSKISGTEFTRIYQAAIVSASLGLHVHAGHGFDFENVRSISRLRDEKGLSLIEEFNIGHSIVCRAALVGLDRAVREMLTALVES